MLRRVVNEHSNAHMTNEELYGNIPKLSTKAASRRLQPAGHWCRYSELSTQKLILWEPTHGHWEVGSPKSSFIDAMKTKTGSASAGELGNMMSDAFVEPMSLLGSGRPKSSKSRFLLPTFSKDEAWGVVGAGKHYSDVPGPWNKQLFGTWEVQCFITFYAITGCDQSSTRKKILERKKPG